MHEAVRKKLYHACTLRLRQRLKNYVLIIDATFLPALLQMPFRFVTKEKKKKENKASPKGK